MDIKYEIIIEYQGKTVTSKTTIPGLTIPDSTWFERLTETDTSGVLWVKLSDDPEEINYYRILTKRLREDTEFIPTSIIAFSDELFNGETLEFSVAPGKQNILDIGTNDYYSVNDTIVVKFCSIDEATYLFWKSIQSKLINAANPFSASNTEIEGNINNGIGIWGGYAVWYDTVIAK